MTHFTREQMLDAIRVHVAETAIWTGRNELQSRVMAAMKAVPRGAFVPESQIGYAYRDSPLPIGRGQTISQPFIVAMMTDLLDLRPGERVLEIGTGCGYQTAVLAELGCEVHTIERIGHLADAARERLDRQGYDTIEYRTADGIEGWPEGGPFDGILVAAACDEVPPKLIDQLADGGRMVIPTGRGHHYLLRLEKTERGIVRQRIFGVAFVPLLPGVEP